MSGEFAPEAAYWYKSISFPARGVPFASVRVPDNVKDAPAPGLVTFVVAEMVVDWSVPMGRSAQFPLPA